MKFAPTARAGLALKLSLRNVWRNPRRTGLTLAATVFAVFLVVVFVAMADGVHGKMIEDGVRLASGHVQVAGRGWLEHRTLEYSLRASAELDAALRATPGVRGVAPRVRNAGLLSHGDATQGVMLLGVDPARERIVSAFPERVREGAFLPRAQASGARPIVLGARLAENLRVGLGDRVLLYSVAYTLENAYDLFEVSGTLHLPDPALERGLALIRLDDAQEFFVLGERVSELALLANNAPAVPAIVAELEKNLPPATRATLEINPWNAVMPELEQFILIDDAGMYVLLLILIIVVGFGILNTILMSVLERQRELGVLLALGLRPAVIFRMVYFESMLLAAGGLALGVLLALPVVAWFSAHPIAFSGAEMEAMAELVGMEPVVSFELRKTTLPFVSATIFLVAALAAFYPALKASRARPVDALRSL